MPVHFSFFVLSQTFQDPNSKRNLFNLTERRPQHQAWNPGRAHLWNFSPKSETRYSCAAASHLQDWTPFQRATVWELCRLRSRLSGI